MKLPSQPNRHRALTRIEVVVIVAVLVFFAWLLRLKFIEARTKANRISCVSKNKHIGLAFRIWCNNNDDKYPYQSPSNHNYRAAPSIPNLAYRNETDAWLYFLVMSNELGSSKLLLCYSDRERLRNFPVDFSSNSTPGKLGLQFTRNSGVSYFIALEADESKPMALLLGDRHLETNAWNVQGSLLTFTSNQPPSWTAALHGYAGNITLSDGSVTQLKNTAWKEAAHQALRRQSVETNRLLMPW